MTIVNLLKARGLIQDCSDLEAVSKLEPGTKFYVGFDPTAASLQLGNLVPLITCIQLIKRGFDAYILFGGATGLIGDPSGKNLERPLLDPQIIANNVKQQSAQVAQIFSRLNLKCQFVNNLDWTSNLDLISFLRDYGKHLTVSYMISKDVIKNRLQDPGISYTEFSYMFLQAMDFLHLFERHDVKLQIGGSDQWGNITAGLELIRKKTTRQAYAFSIPLVTDSKGKKFGKSEHGAIWLDASLTTPYQLYQFLLNIDDQDVGKLLFCLTLCEDHEIQYGIEQIKNNPSERYAQKLLASKVVELVHGADIMKEVTQASQAIFSSNLTELSRDQLLQILGEALSTDMKREQILTSKFIDLLVSTGAVKSKGEARRLIGSKGAYLNNQVISDCGYTLSIDDILQSNAVILRTGKKSYFLINII